jgi:hypothetical protein
MRKRVWIIRLSFFRCCSTEGHCAVENWPILLIDLFYPYP